MSEWISVKERLPEEVMEVLVVVEQRVRLHLGAEHFSRYVLVGWIIDGAWETIYCNGRASLTEQMEMALDVTYSITHWMPLPEPPKEG